MIKVECSGIPFQKTIILQAKNLTHLQENNLKVLQQNLQDTY